MSEIEVKMKKIFVNFFQAHYAETLDWITSCANIFSWAEQRYVRHANSIWMLLTSMETENFAWRVSKSLVR